MRFLSYSSSFNAVFSSSFVYIWWLFSSFSCFMFRAAFFRILTIVCEAQLRHCVEDLSLSINERREDTYLVFCLESMNVVQNIL